MKVAISLPDPLFEAAEKLAHLRSMPRSKLYAEALSSYVNSQNDDEITAQLNSVYGQSGSNLEAGFETAQLEVLADEAW